MRLTQIGILNSCITTQYYFNFNIVSSNIDPIDVFMDGEELASYDYLNLGSNQLVVICGWNSKTIFTSINNGLTFQQQTDFPGHNRHCFFCQPVSNGNLLMLGGDLNDPEFNAKDAWKYTTASGVWTNLTMNMGDVYGLRGGATFIKHKDYVYAIGGQGDSGGSLLYLDVIRIPQNTTTGEDWEYVGQLPNYITAFTVGGGTSDGTNMYLMGGARISSLAHTEFNDKVLKSTDDGFTWTTVSTIGADMVSSYCRMNYFKGELWYYQGASYYINPVVIHNNKGVYHSSNSGVGWNLMYNSPKATHAAPMTKHDDKLFFVGGNAYHGSSYIERLPMPYEVNDLILNSWWLFLTNKPAEAVVTALSTFAQTLDDGGQWAITIDAIYSTAGMITSDQRMSFLFRDFDTTDTQTQVYRTPFTTASISGFFAPAFVTSSNPYYNTVKYGTGTLGLNWNISEHAINSSTDNSGIIIYTLNGTGTNGDDAGQVDTVIIGADEDPNFYGGLYNGGTKILMATGNHPNGFKAVFRDNQTQIKAYSDTTLITKMWSK